MGFLLNHQCRVTFDPRSAPTVCLSLCLSVTDSSLQSITCCLDSVSLNCLNTVYAISLSCLHLQLILCLVIFFSLPRKETLCCHDWVQLWPHPERAIKANSSRNTSPLINILISIKYTTNLPSTAIKQDRKTGMGIFLATLILFYSFLFSANTIRLTLQPSHFGLCGSKK